MTDNKKFWGTMKPDKGVFKNNISLIEGAKVITEDSDVAETLNNYFDEAVLHLGINEPLNILLKIAMYMTPLIQYYLNFQIIQVF